MILALLLGAAAPGQTCTLDFLYQDFDSVNCRTTPARTALPTKHEYGSYNVTAIIGGLHLQNEALTEIPAGGFDACPYTAAIWLSLEDNDITTVGARAFARLAALTDLYLFNNAITWMAATSLDGLARLEVLHLIGNRLDTFDYGALAPMAALRYLYLNGQEGGDLSCGGKDLYNFADEIQAAIASCGSAGSPCSGCAVGCPVGDPGPSPGECFPLPAPPAYKKLSS